MARRAALAARAHAAGSACARIALAVALGAALAVGVACRRPSASPTSARAQTPLFAVAARSRSRAPVARSARTSARALAPLDGESLVALDPDEVERDALERCPSVALRARRPRLPAHARDRRRQPERPLAVVRVGEKRWIVVASAVACSRRSSRATTRACRASGSPPSTAFEPGATQASGGVPGRSAPSSRRCRDASRCRSGTAAERRDEGLDARRGRRASRFAWASRPTWTRSWPPRRPSCGRSRARGTRAARLPGRQPARARRCGRTQPSSR